VDHYYKGCREREERRWWATDEVPSPPPPHYISWYSVSFLEADSAPRI